MQINLSNIGVRFHSEILFKGLDYQFIEGHRYAILGPNGSGKSTLMKVLSAYLSPSKGEISYKDDGIKISKEDFYRSLVYVAPYIDLIGEYTISELYDFHFSFKAPNELANTKKAFADLVELPLSKYKQIRTFSSGMKQRLKLGLAFATDAKVLFLDEPTSNLDRTYIDWYTFNMEKLNKQSLVVIGSNVEEEYEMCSLQINLKDWR